VFGFFCANYKAQPGTGTEHCGVGTVAGASAGGGSAGGGGGGSAGGGVLHFTLGGGPKTRIAPGILFIPLCRLRVAWQSGPLIAWRTSGESHGLLSLPLQQIATLPQWLRLNQAQ